MKKCLDFDHSKRWSASKLLTHEFILEDPCLTNTVDKVDLIRNNAMNWNQEHIKKRHKSKKDLCDSSSDDGNSKTLAQNQSQSINNNNTNNNNLNSINLSNPTTQKNSPK